MDKLRFKNPHRWVRKQLKELGLTVDSSNSFHTFMRTENGAMFSVPSGLSTTDAVRLVTRVRRELGHSTLIKSEKASAPRLERGRLRLSDHALERWRLMQRQDAVGTPELEACLFTPQETRFDRAHNTWHYITSRLVAVVSVADGGVPVLVTVMWSRPELFVKNPRPEAVTNG